MFEGRSRDAMYEDDAWSTYTSALLFATHKYLLIVQLVDIEYVLSFDEYN